MVMEAISMDGVISNSWMIFLMSDVLSMYPSYKLTAKIYKQLCACSTRTCLRASDVSPPILAHQVRKVP